MQCLFTVLLLAVALEYTFGSDNVGVQNDFIKDLNNRNTAKVEVVGNEGFLSAGRNGNQQKAGALKQTLLPNPGIVRETMQPNQANQLNLNAARQANRANPNQVNLNQAFQGEDNQRKPIAVVDTEKNIVQKTKEGESLKDVRQSNRQDVESQSYFKRSDQVQVEDRTKEKRQLEDSQNIPVVSNQAGNTPNIPANEYHAVQNNQVEQKLPETTASRVTHVIKNYNAILGINNNNNDQNNGNYQNNNNDNNGNIQNVANTNQNSDINQNAGNNQNYANNNNNQNFINNNINNQNGDVYDRNRGNQWNKESQQTQIGGINLSWDWEDFSIMFNNYGAAEMKVRRSPHPSTGEPWPMPQYYSKKDNKVYRLSKDFRFVPIGPITCDVLDEALVRHLQRTLRGSVEDMYDNLQHAEGINIEDPALRYEKEEFVKAPVIARVEVRIRKTCDKYPTLESDESYDLVVKKKKTYIWANEIWGVLRGLETFGHLVWRGLDGQLYIKETTISDYPRFPHRGLHIDTSRHYLFKEVLLDILDSMEMNKLNVFHWHIVDDQSFPYESKVYPELSRKGAFHPTYVYSLEDIAEIIEYARMRGIRVMPEFDTPGHTYSWGLSRPELLTQCYSGSSPVKGYLGPIDPSKNATYRFLQSLFQEIVDVFKDQYIHLGGDEVPLGCWQSNPEVMAFAQELAKQPRPLQTLQQQQQNMGWSMWSEDVKRVYEYYENRLIQILNDIGQKRKKGIKYIMWQEVMNNNLQLPNDTIIQVWMGDMGDVMRATTLGYQVLYSTCWYMDHIEYGTKWPKYYNCDPVDSSYGYHIDEKKVLGGEAAFWSEYFTNENLIPMMWPRASAAAERLWSNKEVKNLDKAAERLAEHRCRMIKRGISAGEISGPGYCLHSPPKRRLYNDTVGCQGGNCSRTHNFVHIEDIQLHVSQRGGPECASIFTKGGINTLVIGVLILALIIAAFALTRNSSRLHRSRICKNRSILVVFVVVLLVYFLCYTTIWMRGFEFSGTFHKTLQEDDSTNEQHGAEMSEHKHGMERS
ncbi:uncharacterized protein LOC131946628 [Physella acuta]|uniref:uncharacterized protein LOC131946628 n=1 Tax=Physella acuta TaxID=109671 RepID=UPI0027DC8BBE|nr:uncharacterized protein LOC131946628 [Physella acuta]